MPSRGIRVSNTTNMCSARIVDSSRGRNGPPIPAHARRIAGESISLRLCRCGSDAVIDMPGAPEHTVSFVVGRPAVVEYCDGRKSVRESYQPREGWLIPAGVRTSFRLVGAAVIACLGLSSPWFAEAAASEFGLEADRIALLERPRLRDTFLWMVVAGLLRRNRILPALDPLVRDALALGLACYLIRGHSSVAEGLGRTVGRDDRALVSDFLDDVVASELGLGQLAQVIGVAEGELMACFSDADTERLRIHMQRVHVAACRTPRPGSDAFRPQPPRRLSRTVGALRLMSPARDDVASYFVFGCPAAECEPVR